ncbi:acetyl-CoA carboxylase biotin carboxyl carrier protein [Ancylothrix sp. C2]|uniref:acetyl-CoA carboxylase biotin carboxyl carrier protein n=1 Tax=Ancylothrix sp. D3o TaxID=2953691 RepID=UPI0021BA47E6|nr:acetyl-CoA carboxylase biotin carboxyl carrier protein [Ancylothrix sp. D3o]MCT7949405.1 acetyl-CoA carboxylase biotin carboxyl carrier protein [Ancylothrix sp. D3o]
MQLDLKEIRELLAALDQTDISELMLKSGDFELTVRKNSHSVEVHPPESGPAEVRLSAPPAPVVSPEPSPAIAAQPSAGPPASDKKLVDVMSPMVGTFYRAPAPDEPPFVEVGDRITTGSTVCIIEAMKLMNEIDAEVSGTVVEILGKNGAPVEYGQVLMRIKVD